MGGCPPARCAEPPYARAVIEILASRFLLHPTDLDRSLRFYEETIELAVYREWAAGTSRSVAFFLGGGGVLEVSGGSPQPPSAATGLVLQVRDLDAAHALLVGRGVTPEAEPELKPWGLLEMTVRDPDGLALIFVEVPADHPRRVTPSVTSGSPSSSDVRKAGPA